MWLRPVVGPPSVPSLSPPTRFLPMPLPVKWSSPPRERPTLMSLPTWSPIILVGLMNPLAPPWP